MFPISRDRYGILLLLKHDFQNVKYSYTCEWNSLHIGYNPDTNSSVAQENDNDVKNNVVAIDVVPHYF